MTPRPLRLWCLSGLALATLTLNAQPAATSPAPAEGTAVAPAGSGRLTVAGNPGDLYDRQLNAPELPLKLLLPMVEDLTGRIILRRQGLPNPDVPMVFKTPPTRGEFLQAIETVLTLNGIALVPLGEKFLKVIPLGNARIEAPPLIEESTLTLPSSGQIGAKLFQLQFLRVGEFVPQISNLLNGSVPVMFEKANAVLITESITTLQRIEMLVDKVDRPIAAGTAVKFYTLVNGAKASDIVNKLRTFLQPLQGQIGATTSYNADDRTNQIVLFADPRQFPLFDELIAKLDVKSDPNTRNEVIYLKHAAAKDVASILSQLVSGQNNAARATESAGAGRPMAVTTAAPAGNGTPAAPAAAPALTFSGSPSAAALGLESSNQFSALLTILAEERSNSIVVSGTVDDIRLINDLVTKIDVLLAQVRIEVVIAEVTLSDNATSGISALGLKIDGDKLVGGQISGAGFVGSNVTATIQTTGDRDLAAEVGLSTTPRKSNAAILSLPNIMTTHNKEATIFVGEQRPVISSYLNDSTTGGTANVGTGYRSTVSSKDIGISLKVKPLIGNDGSVQLEVTQEVNDILGDITIDGNPQPRIGRRSTASFVSARTGEIIVLGGLQRTSKSKSTSRLGPIPIIGDLLGSRSREDQRTDLVFFLRPTVLTNTAADNAPAIEQVKALPKNQRDPILDALGEPKPDAKKK